MYERCPKCKNRTGFSPDQPGALTSCPSCGHVFPPAPELGIPSPDPEMVVVGARDTAGSPNQATARSLGSGLRDAAAAASSARSSLPYDPGFREAVEAGRLTPAQAAQRGDRNLWASKLVKRYLISMEEALLVTDNKKTLDEITQTTTSSVPDHAPAQSGQSSRSRILVVASSLVVGVLASVQIWRMQSAGDGGPVVTPPPRTSAQSKTEVSRHEILKDTQGRITAVTAPTPDAVLDDFCQSSGAAVPRIRARVVPTQQGWLGVLREGTAEYSIFIRQDMMTGLYSAGDGVSPLVVQPLTLQQGIN